MKYNLPSRLKLAFNALAGRYVQLDKDGFPYFGFQTKTGELITPDSALYVSTVFSCINLLASVIASLPVNVYLTEDDGDILPEKASWLYKLLRYKPNGWQTAYEYWYYNIECILLRGGFISYKNTVGNRVASLIPLNPDSLTRSQGLDGTIYISGTAQWGYNKTINFDKVPQDKFFWCNYRTLDTVNPCSIIKHAAETIGLAKTASDHGARVFANDATPPLIVSVPKALDEKGLINLAKMWKAGGTGDNYGMPRFLDQGADIKRLSMSNEDAQYLQTRKFSKEEIAGMFRVPLHLIGDTGGGKGWNTLDQLGQEFLTYTLSPYLTNIEQAINRSFIPEKEWGSTFANFETRNLTKANAVSRTSYNKEMYYIGALSPNEIRRSEGFNNREGGDEYVRAVNLAVSSNKPADGAGIDDSSNDPLTDSSTSKETKQI